MFTSHPTSSDDPDPPSRFQRHEWNVRRGARGVFSLLLLGAAMGLFGKGPLAHTFVQDPTLAAGISHDRFLRNDAEFLVRFVPVGDTIQLEVLNVFDSENDSSNSRRY